MVYVVAMKLYVVLEKQDEGGYTVYVPNLPGCISEGETKEEAIENIKEAISLYVEEVGKKEIEALLHKVSVAQTEVPVHA